MSNRYRSTHLDFSAWLYMRDYALIDLTIDRPGRGEYTFEISPEEVISEKVAWAASELVDYMGARSTLQSLAYGEAR